MASPSDPTEPPTLIPNPTSTVDQENANPASNKSIKDPEESDLQPEPSIEETKNEEDDMEAVVTPAVTSSYYRRGGGPKRKKGQMKKLKQIEKSKEKLEKLLTTLKPIAFVPNKALDYGRHEKLLKTLGLWDFLHLEFDQNIRQDLVANLVAYYSSEGRCSYVNGSRINISRADLARALKLPKKKDVVISEEEKEVLERDESVKFIEEVLSNFVLIERDDTWMMPAEVFEWGNDIKNKQVEKLDWSAMIWFMVEKELKSEQTLGDCFFASHLQMMIKTQKEDLLKDVADVGDDDGKEVDFMVKSPKEDCVVEVKEDDVVSAAEQKEDCVEVMEEDVVDVTEQKEERYVAEHMIELCLGQETASEVATEQKEDVLKDVADGDDDDVKEVEEVEEQQPMEVEENKNEVEENKIEEEEVRKWLWNEDSSHAGSSHFLRRCDFSNATEGDDENKIEGLMQMGEDVEEEEEPIEDANEEEEIEEEEDKEKNEDEGFPFFPNGVSQDNLMLGDTSPLGYGDFLTSRVDMGAGTSSLFGNGNNSKRGIDYHSDNPETSKRLRTEEPSSWDDKPTSMEACLDQASYWIEKTKMSLAETNQEHEQTVMHQQYLMNEVQHKAEIIQELERTKFEELHKKDLLIYRLENELRLMASVVEGYQKSMKEMKKVYRDHRKRCPLRGDEKPVYQDVPGSGGLVLSVGEIEKMRLKKEEEDRVTRVLIEKQIEEFGNGWVKVFEGHMEEVELMNERLIEVENGVKVSRESVKESRNLEKEEEEVDTAVTEEVTAAVAEEVTPGGTEVAATEEVDAAVPEET